jgi:hypothetical protein
MERDQHDPQVRACNFNRINTDPIKRLLVLSTLSGAYKMLSTVSVIELEQLLAAEKTDGDPAEEIQKMIKAPLGELLGDEEGVKRAQSRYAQYLKAIEALIEAKKAGFMEEVGV